MMIELKQNIDLAQIVESAGVELKPSGTRYVGLCPFHPEKHPSFFIKDNHFKCFGCQEHGDVIDFVQKMYGLTFPDALKHLGLKAGKITPKVKEEIQKRKREKQKEEAIKRFEANLHYTLSMLVDATRKAMKAIKTIDDFEQHGEVVQDLPWWEYNLELLNFGSIEDRREVCQEFKDFEVLQAERLFKPEFNYSKWLSEFNEKGMPDEWSISLHFARGQKNRAEAPNTG